MRIVMLAATACTLAAAVPGAAVRAQEPALRAQAPAFAAGDTAVLQTGSRRSAQVVIEAVVGDSADVRQIGRYLALLPKPTVPLTDLHVAGLDIPRALVATVTVYPRLVTARVPLAALRPAREPRRLPPAPGGGPDA
jgi:hypothetical protein